MNHLHRTALAIVLLAPLAARGANVPVLYTVEEKPLKSSAPAGTMFTFALYSDPACTNQVHTASVAVENVTLIVRLKQLTPHGDTKLPNTDALEHTLPGVTATGNLYLEVTGTGIVPVGGVCQAQAAQVPVPACNDGVQNQGETDVDCGGATICPRCAVGKDCNGNGDCSTSNCVSGICAAAPSCTDGIQNQDETDVDCGGTFCPPCAAGQGCGHAMDCASMVCMGGTCQAPSCTDMVKNGNETDVDCGGGTCPGCTSGKLCLVGSDCVSNVCAMLHCQ